MTNPFSKCSNTRKSKVTDMNYEIQPLKGIGSIEFGMLSTKVRSLIGGEFKSFKRSPAAAYPCDYFPHIGVFAYYKGSGELEAIELALPAQPTLDGMNLFDIGFDAVKVLLKSKDTGLHIEIDGAISPALGISLYAPDAKENPATICESVLVFEKGYYD